MKGIIFAIEEFCVYDGPGIRTCVFFKGCPLICNWCHNPEGLSFQRQIVRNPNGCLDCRKCRAVCENPDDCIICGKCVDICPERLIRISGDIAEAKDIADIVKKNSDVMDASGGGVTLSGGEVLSQPEFAIELLDELEGLHRAIETSGYAENKIFNDIISRCELVIMDIKIINRDLHKYHTGVYNDKIIKNYQTLKKSGIPHIIRVPLIPGVNDTIDNFESLCKLIKDDENLIMLEILPYIKMAGAKYKMMNLKYLPKFNTDISPVIHEEILKKYGIKFKIS